ncbi:homoserine kinase [Synechococcus elongatus]|uniref:homoserine kinase n=1 Tax=Synechococcus elongatus TaxID=32046 RepID=UPI000F7EFFC0|nr:homoserine kinase [Synechococcus elongatus]
MRVRVAVPATTANLGPGFDCLGAALTLYNHFWFAPASTGELEITARGMDAEKISGDRDNLVYRAFAAFFEKQEQPVPALKLEIELAVPLARGLGSSATAIVAGLVGANALAGSPWSNAQLCDLATELEGHPDNVVPALLGGCRLAARDRQNQWAIADLDWHPDLIPVVAIPDFELSTEAARQVLPTQYSRSDAIFNAAHVGLVVRSLASGNGEWLAAALQDRLHQPYRQALIPGYAAVETAALEAGAFGLVISGAGPTLLAISSPDRAEAVRQAMLTTWQATGLSVRAEILAIAESGTQIERETEN